MALIKCPECEREISDKAKACPQCGFPINEKKYKGRMVEYSICKRCGFIPTGYFTKCHFCGSEYFQYTSDVPLEDYLKMSTDSKNNIEKGILENVIKKSPEFSQNAMDKRLIQDKKELEELARGGSGLFSSKSSASCPYCNSSNTRKISTGSRLLSTGFFGLGSSKIGKNYHCNSCGSDF